jgi:hypothetical protein
MLRMLHMRGCAGAILLKILLARIRVGAADSSSKDVDSIIPPSKGGIAVDGQGEIKCMASRHHPNPYAR